MCGRVPNMETHQLAWFAGVIDGEGSFGAYPNRDGIHYPRLTVVQSGSRYPEMLERCKSIVSGYQYTDQRIKDTHAIKWTWAVEGYEKVQYVLCLVWPWLGSIKKMQAVEALQSYRNDRHKVAKTWDERLKKSWKTRRGVST